MSNNNFNSAVQSQILDLSGFEFQKLVFSKPVTRIKQVGSANGVGLDGEKKEFLLFLGITAAIVACFTAVKSLLSSRTSEYSQILENGMENEIIDGDCPERDAAGLEL